MRPIIPYPIKAFPQTNPYTHSFAILCCVVCVSCDFALIVIIIMAVVVLGLAGGAGAAPSTRAIAEVSLTLVDTAAQRAALELGIKPAEIHDQQLLGLAVHRIAEALRATAAAVQERLNVWMQATARAAIASAV